MASPNSTPPLFLHLHEYALETAAAMQALELRTVEITGMMAVEHLEQDPERTHAAA